MTIPTEAQVRLAYERNGFIPVAFEISPAEINGNGACCALGAICDGKARDLNEAQIILGYDEVGAFSFGFDRGFSGAPVVAFDQNNTSEDYQAGYKIGRSLREFPISSKSLV